MIPRKIRWCLISMLLLQLDVTSSEDEIADKASTDTPADILQQSSFLVSSSSTNPWSERFGIQFKDSSWKDQMNRDPSLQQFDQPKATGRSFLSFLFPSLAPPPPPEIIDTDIYAPLPPPPPPPIYPAIPFGNPGFRRPPPAYYNNLEHLDDIEDSFVYPKPQVYYPKYDGGLSSPSSISLQNSLNAGQYSPSYSSSFYSKPISNFQASSTWNDQNYPSYSYVNNPSITDSVSLSQISTNPSLISQGLPNPALINQGPINPALVNQLPINPALFNQGSTNPALLNQRPIDPALIQQINPLLLAYFLRNQALLSELSKERVVSQDLINPNQQTNFISNTPSLNLQNLLSNSGLTNTINPNLLSALSTNNGLTPLELLTQLQNYNALSQYVNHYTSSASSQSSAMSQSPPTMFHENLTAINGDVEYSWLDDLIKDKTPDQKYPMYILITANDTAVLRTPEMAMSSDFLSPVYAAPPTTTTTTTPSYSPLYSSSSFKGNSLNWDRNAVLLHVNLDDATIRKSSPDVLRSLLLLGKPIGPPFPFGLPNGNFHAYYLFNIGSYRPPFFYKPSLIASLLQPALVLHAQKWAKVKAFLAKLLLPFKHKYKLVFGPSLQGFYKKLDSFENRLGLSYPDYQSLPDGYPFVNDADTLKKKTSESENIQITQRKTDEINEGGAESFAQADTVTESIEKLISPR